MLMFGFGSYRRDLGYSLHRFVSLAMVLLICLAATPTVAGQTGITSILHLQYRSQAALQNGVAQIPVTFTLYFNYYRNPQGYLVFGIFLSGTSTPVDGSATSTPDPCQSLVGTPYASDAICAMIPPVSAGTESASATLILNQAQQYSLSVVTFVWDSTNLQSGNQVQGSTSITDFTITITGQATQPSSASTSIQTSVSTSLPQATAVLFTNSLSTPVTQSLASSSTQATSWAELSSVIGALSPITLLLVVSSRFSP